RLVEPRLLHQWKVDCHRVTALHHPETCAVYYADNLHALTVWLSVVVNFSSYCAVSGKEPAREALANDDDPWTVLVVMPVEFPARYETHPDQVEKIRTNQILYRVQRRAG